MNHRPEKYAFAAIASTFAMASGHSAHAAIAVGQASATVVSELVSMPVMIRLQVLQLNTQLGATDVGLSSNQRTPQAEYQPTEEQANERRVESSGSRSTVVGLDAEGVASFSVSGDTTSGYLVKVNSSANSGGLIRAPASANMATNVDANGSAELIVPAQALNGLGRLSIAISQASAKGRSGGINVQINHN